MRVRRVSLRAFLQSLLASFLGLDVLVLCVQRYHNSSRFDTRFGFRLLYKIGNNIS